MWRAALAFRAKSACSAYYIGADFHRGVPSRLTAYTTQVQGAVMTAMRLFNRAFYGVENNFALGSRLTMHESVLMYLPSAIVEDIDELRLPPIVRKVQFDVST